MPSDDKVGRGPRPWNHPTVFRFDKARTDVEQSDKDKDKQAKDSSSSSDELKTKD